MECGPKEGQQGGYMFSDANILSPGGGVVLGIKKDICYLNLTEVGSKDKLKGKIWIYPLFRELKIDFSKNFKKDYTVWTNDNAVKALVLTNEKLEKDIKIKFEYSDSYKDDKVGQQKLKNPFTVCQGDDCQNEVKTYTFKKDENYVIKFNFEKKTVSGFERDLYFLPKFSIKSSGKFVSFSLISMILFLLFYIGD